MRGLRIGTLGIVLLHFITAGCGSSAKAVFIYHDLRCPGPLPDGGAADCVDVGDGASHVVCETDRDCPAQAPFCRILGLYSGGNYSCNQTIRVCRSLDHNDCPP